jgi:predicted small metal-binding protein
MKEFACANLEKNCNVVLTAQTEERLVELASLHLREVHGMTSLSQEKMADIRKLFTSRPTADAAKVVDRIFEKYNCNGEPECSWRYIAEAEMILTGGKTAHVQELKAA